MVTGRKLLLADDSITIQKVIDLTFSDEGLEVVTVSDGQQALEKLEEFTPDIVLADVFMPRLSGYKVCEHIKRTERLSHIPVMLLVGSFEPFDEAEARRVGADDYLTKPFQSIRTLIGKVRNLLSGGGAGRAEAATQRLTPPAEVEKENRPDSGFLERSTADTAPLPDVEKETAGPAGGHSREISFADLSMDDEMIETKPAHDYGGAVQSRETVQYSAADLKDAGIPQAVETTEPVRAQEASAVAASYGAPPVVEPAHAALGQTQAAAATSSTSSTPPSPRAANMASSDDALLDLGDIESPSAGAEEADDFFLDLFDETPRQPEASAQSFKAPAAQPFAEASSQAAETGAAFDAAPEPQAQEFVEGQVFDAGERGASSAAETAPFSGPDFSRAG
ncbi:MAG TPA: response regulator, partial [Pyrinomonadaceae bacterium]|nr:response regulator [Pyrinomonadaceae bacterium]